MRTKKGFSRDPTYVDDKGHNFVLSWGQLACAECGEIAKGYFEDNNHYVWYCPKCSPARRDDFFYHEDE